jgi:RimJ/RimL family protein N-acetyltransferase
MTKLSLKILGPGDERALKRFLLTRLDSSLFLYSNMLAAGLEDTGVRFSGTYAAAFEGREIVAVAGHFWNQTMVLQAPVQLPALMRLAQKSCGRPLKRLIGPDEQVKAAMDALALTGDNLQMDEPEKLYSLELGRLVMPALLTGGRARGRLAQSGDEDLLTEWRLGYYLEMHLAEDNAQLRKTARQNAQAEIASGRTWLLEVEAKRVSCTSFNASVRDEGAASVVQVGGVYTPPDFRSRGYARAVVAASLADARSRDYHKSVLFTGIGNVAAQRAYEAIGFRLIGSYRITILREALLDLG